MQAHPLIHVDASKFALRKVSSNCTLNDFCGKCVPKADISAVYVELDCVEDVNDILDVMLLDKVGLNYVLHKVCTRSTIFIFYAGHRQNIYWYHCIAHGEETL